MVVFRELGCLNLQYLAIRALIGLCGMALAAKKDLETGFVEDWHWLLMLVSAFAFLFLDGATAPALIASVLVVSIPLFVLMHLNFIGDGDFFLLVSLQALVPGYSNGIPIAFVAFALGSAFAMLHKRSREVRLVPYLLAGYIVALLVG